MKSENGIVKRIAGTLVLPVCMYIVMMILCYANGKTYFGAPIMWKSVIVDIAVLATCALGIGLQFKSGRFDFSGGAIMLIGAIIAGNTAKNMSNNIVLYAVLCMVICIVLSVLVSLMYVFGRLPIIIATIGMALLYEAITALIYNGAGVNLTANLPLKVLSTFPGVLIPFIGSIAVYAIYSYLTVTGKQAVLLSNNQQSAVNIGINEKKNVIVSYLFSGIIFGFATMIYGARGIISASFSSLSTVGSLFSNILPVFIGLMLMGFCGDLIGTLVGAFTLAIMSFGLQAVFSAEMGTAISTVITGVFILLINVVSAQGGQWIATIKAAFTGGKKVQGA